jgi:transcriptional regulator with XRE-family HTH domain
VNELNEMLDTISRKAPDQLDVALGASVRLRRRTLGMSQEMLAEACGVSFQQIQKYENGGNRISFSRLVQIAGALKCRVGDLIAMIEDGQGEGPRDLGVHARLALPGAMELLEAYESMAVSTRNHLLGLIRDLAAA